MNQNQKKCAWIPLLRGYCKKKNSILRTHSSKRNKKSLCSTNSKSYFSSHLSLSRVCFQVNFVSFVARKKTDKNFKALLKKGN